MTGKTKNILFIMYDQLRFDYLSCYGHPYLHTPNFDRVALMGVQFTRCYVQSPICGPSRMSTYTGRYCHSHGAQQNNYPLKVGEQTMGDHLRKLGMGCHLIGKTHMQADAEGMKRLGMNEDSIIGVRTAECGFDPYVRDDGLWAEGPDGYYDEKRSPYNEYLKAKGYPSHNPWHDFANSGVDDHGDIASGWLMMHADKPANIREEDSETPWLTSRTIDFIEEQDPDQPWLAHVSYIKPHWPYIVPAPYHNMYGPNQVLPARRSEAERVDAHPVFEGFMNNPVGRAFQRQDVRDTVIPAYMGLIKQCDDQLGRLLDYLEKTGRMDETMIVLTSDHGDYLGDHWMGEKDLFHEPSVKVPLIIYDPAEAADGTRGTVCDELVQAIDLSATFIETAGGEVPDHIVEGCSLVPFLHGETPENWRVCAISEYDYGASPIARNLGLEPCDGRLFMVATKRWKFMHAEGGLRPMLFDLENDPDEFTDLATDPEHASVLDQMYEHLGQWARRMSQRTTLSEKDIKARGGKAQSVGVLIGVYDQDDVEGDALTKYTGKAPIIPQA
ncbi:MAG: sulfatase-like hydrolase/transferase [Rhodobacteraceae bacterium]|nr:sulfatase-like hydrolase/transferase [Paracoccaceae bacterium]